MDSADDALEATLAHLYETARRAYPEVTVARSTFAAELTRRLHGHATAEQLTRLRVDHVYLAIACVAGDDAAIRRFERDFLDDLDTRLRARREQIDEVRGHLRRVLFVDEPGRTASLAAYSGRGDLGSFVRVIATRELGRILDKGRREVGVGDDAVLDLLSPMDDPELDYLRDRYRADVDAAMRVAIATLGAESRALLRYSLVDGWNVDRIGALYGIHRATAARRVAAAREELGAAIRRELAARLAITVDDVDSIVRLVQSRIDVSLERLLG